MELARKGMRQVDLSKKAKIPESTVTKLVTGRYKSPTLSLLGKVARGLGMSPSQLLERAENL